ncbi:MAG: hypothetical protein HYX78_09970 [Armatimonadetes bacterium]|nr:hypothetical protein [Armatimonadota bacterium]
MRCLTPFAALALVAVLGLSVYNSWQISRINRELAALRMDVSSSGPALDKEEEFLSALELVKRHTERARELLAGGQTGRARHELDRSLRWLERISSLSEDTAGDAARGITSTISAVQKEIEKAMEELSKQTPKRRPGGNETAGSE